MTSARVAPFAGDGVPRGIQPAGALQGNEQLDVMQNGQVVRMPLATIMGAPNAGNLSGLFYARAAITSQQAATLASSPLLVIPAPGVGKVIMLVQGAVLYRAGTTPTAAASFGFGPSQADMGYLPVSLVLGSADEFAHGFASTYNPRIANLVNKPIYFCASLDTHAADPGHFEVHVLYFLMEA